MTTSRRRIQGSYPLLWLLLASYLACGVSGSRARHHHQKGAIKGEHLRQRQAMISLANTDDDDEGITNLDWDRSSGSRKSKRHRQWKQQRQRPAHSQPQQQQRQLYTDRSRIGAIGTDEEDPFFEADGENDLQRHRLASTSPPIKSVHNNDTTTTTTSMSWNDTDPDLDDLAIVERTMNVTSYTMLGGVIIKNDDLDEMGTISLAEPPAMSPTTTTTVTAAEKAQSASIIIISGAQENLAEGRNNKGGKKSGKLKGSLKSAASGKSLKSPKITDASARDNSGKKSGKLKGKSNKLKTASGSKRSGEGGGGGMSMSAYGFFASSGGGKGGKGGMSGSGSAFASSTTTTTFVTPAVLNPQEQTVTTPPTPAPVLVIISNAQEYPAAGPMDDNYPPTRGGVPADCKAIAQGTAERSANGKEESFTIRADWVLAPGANFDTVKQEVTEYLQSKVAPSIAGCEDTRQRRYHRNRNRRRHRQLTRRSLQFLDTGAIIDNVKFEHAVTDGEGSCSASYPNTCHITHTPVKIHYIGVDPGIGLRLLAFLQAAGRLDVEGLAAVKNLRVFDRDNKEVGSTNTNRPTVINSSGSSGGSVVSGGSSIESNAAIAAESPEDVEGVDSWTETMLVIGLSAAAAFFGVVLFYLVCQRCRSYEDRPDFESLPPEKDPGEPLPDKQTWPLGDDLSGDVGGSNVARRSSKSFIKPRIGNSGGAKEREAEVHMNYLGDTHICSSSFCEVCSLPGPPQIQFVSSAAVEPFNELPPDATRTYYAEDTVKL